MAVPPPPPLDRTPSAHARYVTAGVRCFERSFEGWEKKPPVKLIVFDCDETLTLSTFMPKDKALRTTVGWIEWAEFIANVNFESPFVDGSRIEKMKECFESLKTADSGEERILTILTRNESGAVACLNLLMMAKLDEHFSAIWSMHATSNFGNFNACYKNGSKWEKFESPIRRCYDHKADVLIDVTQKPFDWFPQLTPEGTGAAGEDLKGLLDLKPENIVLVDDVRTNFQSHSPAMPKILRYCKIARYDSEYREMGMVTNMGGLGARNVEDYRQLEEFVSAPWRFKEAHCIRCSERPFENAQGKPPVNLVVFDFDETLSLYTFIPEDKRYRTQIGFDGRSTKEKEYYVKYNFETPYVTEGDRIVKLKAMLKRLVSSDDCPRSLAILTKNEDGAVMILNLLLMANLAEYFSVIWTLGAGEGFPNGVYKDTDGWKVFDLPLGNTQEQKYKPIVLKQVVERPDKWFPQIPKGPDPASAHIKEMFMWNIVLVDDERTAFQCDNDDGEGEMEAVLRYVKVAHYDDEFRDQGLLVHMGGIGAKTDKDYEALVQFVEAPWRQRVADSSKDIDELTRTGRAMSFCTRGMSDTDIGEKSPVVALERRTTEEKISSASRKLRKSVTLESYDRSKSESAIESARSAPSVVVEDPAKAASA